MRQPMKSITEIGLLAMSIAVATACQSAQSDCGTPPQVDVGRGLSLGGEFINLSDRLRSGRLRNVNRDATALASGSGVRVTAAPGSGLIWIDGTDFANGTIEADVCGRDVQSESFVGIAFHRRNDEIYEAVYLRPFNFRSMSSERRQHAVQYVAMPEYDYSRLREAFPGEFEKSVDPSVVPKSWNRLRLIVGNGRVQVFVGHVDTPALDVRQLQSATQGGQVGLYVDNGSDGVFANLHIVRAF
jgi:hypothetical protein